MKLEEELRAIWDNYDRQREADRNIAKVRADATAKLHALNQERLAVGLPTVGEFTSHSFQGAQVGYVGPAPKTWRDEMEAALLSAIHRRFQ